MMPAETTEHHRDPPVIDRAVKGCGAASTSSTLLERVRARSDDAWQRFGQLYRPLVLGWARQAGLQDADAEDVAQDVFQAVHGAIADFRHDRSGDTLRGWLRTITRNKARDLARRAAREPPGAGGEHARAELLAAACPPPAGSDVADRDEQRALLRRALDMTLADFADRTRRAFWAVVVEGRAPAEVARELGVGVHVVYLAKSRVLKRLRDEFEGLVDLGRWPPAGRT